jgi:hypothetical protein
MVSLFDASGVYIDMNDDGDLTPIDPATDSHYDSSLVIGLPGGDYVVALTQYDNLANAFVTIGTTLSDGFTRQGQPTFTTGPDFLCGAPGGMFFDAGCFPRTGDWALDFLGVDSAVAVPEPGLLVLSGSGLALLAVTRRSRTKG